MDNVQGLTDWDRLKDLLAGTTKSGESRDIDEEDMRTALKARVRGQDHVIDDVCRLIRQQWGKKERNRPIANLFFVGPTGTGKTELAKAMAAYLYEDEKNMVRFDCGEFTGPEGLTRLIGTPTGYVGAESGGHLTRPVLNNKKRFILFDEIEKAYSQIFNVFLSMMGEGKVTEQGSGRVADFTQSIIVLTSNAEAEAIAKIDAQISDAHERTNAIKQHLRDSKVFRAEILGRFDRIYVFKPLSGLINAEIAILKIRALAKEYGLELAYVSPELVVEAMNKSAKLADFGVRELDRVIQELLGDAMYEAKRSQISRVRLKLDDDGALAIEPADDQAP